MTWWTLTYLEPFPRATSALVWATTTLEDHLYMAWAYHKPSRQPIYKTVRGMRVICGYRYVWDTPNIQQQTEPGDTLDHTLSISGLTPLSTIYYYVFAPDGPYGLEIQGPLDSFTLPPAPPGPQPTDTTYYWDVPNRILRCGNHYTWWENDTWYALVPTKHSLTMWKLIEGTFTRQDQPHEPPSETGDIRDADSRVDTGHTYIAVAYYNKSTSPNDHLEKYVKYDLATDTWGIPEVAQRMAYHIWSIYHTSLALDSNDKPHVVFPYIELGFCVLYYSNKVGVHWSAVEEAISGHYRSVNSPSAWITPASNAFHVIGVFNTYLMWYVQRPEGGPFWDPMISLDVGVNLPNHSIMVPHTCAHIGQIDTDRTLNHHECMPPYDQQEGLSPAASQFANVIANPGADEHVCIYFHNPDNNIAYVYRPAGGAWGSPVELPYPTTFNLTATYNHPDVVSLFWQEAGYQALAFRAIYAPWH